ncbi:hypothetical protein EVA_19770, partial [gut metagenome]
QIEHDYEAIVRESQAAIDQANAAIAGPWAPR